MKENEGPIFPLEELSPETYVKLPQKPAAESGSIKMYIICVEPNLYLEGFSKDEIAKRPPSVLRGALFVRVLKPIKIKTISLTFRGVSRTEWPEGIPPKREEFQEVNEVIRHTWPFFDYQYTPNTSDQLRPKGTDIFIPRTEDELHDFNSLTPMASHGSVDLSYTKSPTSLMSALIGSSSNSSSNVKSPKKTMKNVLMSNFKSSQRSVSNNSDLIPRVSSSSSINSTSGNDDAKLFRVGDYIYTFELPIQSSLPESTRVAYGSTKYMLEASIEKSGKFKSNLYGHKQINLIRAPFQDSVEENQPIIINREWEGRLQYDIVIYSKQVVLNSYLPISFRMTPLDKVKVHRLRVYMTEHSDYYCHNKKVHRTEPQKKVLLLEHKPPEGMPDNLLALNDDEIGGMELDFQVFIPESYGVGRRLNPESDANNIQCHHWIKICIRISRSEPTPENPEKRKQYELTIDSPMHLLSPMCAHANTLLPSYDDQMDMDNSNELSASGLDKSMTPAQGTILHSNLYKPNDDTPQEMLTPQAKPFSPIASPQLNAINPELRENGVLKPIDMLEMLSPITSASKIPQPTAVSNSQSSIATLHRPSLQHQGHSFLQSQVSIRAQSPVSHAPPPPFAEHPPTYEEATYRKSTVSTEKTTYSHSSNDSSKSNSLAGLSGTKKKHITEPQASIVLQGPIATKPSTLTNKSNNTRGRDTRERDLSGDEEEDISFHITPIRSSDPSPSHSPLRPMHNISKLVNKNFIPGFHHDNSENEGLDSALDKVGLLLDPGSEDDQDEDYDLGGNESFYANGSMLTIDTLTTQAPTRQPGTERGGSISTDRRGSVDLLKLLKTQSIADSMDITDM